MHGVAKTFAEEFGVVVHDLEGRYTSPIRFPTVHDPEWYVRATPVPDRSMESEKYEWFPFVDESEARSFKDALGDYGTLWTAHPFRQVG